MCWGHGLVVKQLVHPPTPTHVHTCVFQHLKSPDFESLPVVANVSVILSMQDKDAGEDMVKLEMLFSRSYPQVKRA